MYVDGNCIIGECDHCGKSTVLKLVAEHKRTTDDDMYFTGTETVEWSLLECQYCYGIMLQKVSSHSDDDNDENGMLPQVAVEILYPTFKTPLKNLPDTVSKEYKEAIKVMCINPNLFAVSVGRTLEAICNHEKADGKTLAQKLKSLAGTDCIPIKLANMANQLKELRNLGAHNAEDEVTKEDVPIILEFLEAILEYIYVAPAKIEALQKRLKGKTKRASDELGYL